MRPSLAGWLLMSCAVPTSAGAAAAAAVQAPATAAVNNSSASYSKCYTKSSASCGRRNSFSSAFYSKCSVIVGLPVPGATAIAEFPEAAAFTSRAS
mmetsp:Transcript_4677/g.12804  ORF Transcript_4677/g.12804 Transcript_4677/m.12804 type:complete len:96 (-) Transcript_4677:741-1028(-)